jgi:hypothetical protein
VQLGAQLGPLIWMSREASAAADKASRAAGGCGASPACSSPWAGVKPGDVFLMAMGWL